MSQVKMLSDFATIPSRGSPFAAGLDLSSAVDSVVPARGKVLVKTDIAIAIPENTYARVGKCLYWFCIFKIIYTYSDNSIR